MKEILSELKNHKIATRLLLTGKIVVARDIAHAKLEERVKSGADLPQYSKIILSITPAPQRRRKVIRQVHLALQPQEEWTHMYRVFQERSGSMIMLAKGNRSKIVTESCKKNGGFYLGSIGGPAARLGKECITNIETLEYSELGMEAIL